MRSNVPTYLYRFFCAEDILLYVGITHDIERRAQEHSNKSSWFDRAARMTKEKFPNRLLASKKEEEAIINENPLFNINHSNIANVDPSDYPQEYITDMAKWTVNIFGEYIKDENGEVVFKKHENPVLEEYIAKEYASQ